jgi:hypothetical protein
MAEPRRIDDELTTPQVSERDPHARESDVRPSLLRNEARKPVDPDIASPSAARKEAESSPYREDAPVVAEGRPMPVATLEAIEIRQESAARADQPAPATGPDRPALLFDEAVVGDYRSRWSTIQTAFVDEPRHAVEEADGLVKSLLNKLSAGFTSERERLAGQWERGDDVSTEDLRVALQCYRAFFDRLLNI